ncbi:MAG TPA: RHS repeat-associated core domain-containing protein [Ktedonobacterales bacterium]|jgi:RHS repeat-associated protein
MSYGDSSHLHAATSSTSGETASYDASGNMTCRAPTSALSCAGGSPTGASLTYDAERRLKYWQNGQNGQPITSQVWFLYDGEGHRVEQYVSGGSGSHTYYLPGNLEEVTPSGTLVKYYTAGGIALGENTTTGSTGISYLASDGLGSVSEALNQTGTATGSTLYGPYGSVRYSTGTLPTSKGFTGQYADANTGLDYYGARYYDPSLGQFTSADTVTDGLNRYGYVKGNPETATDPSGHRIVQDNDGPYSAPPQNPRPRSVNTPFWGLGDFDLDSCYPKGCYNDAGQSHRSDEYKAGEKLAAYFGVHVNRLDDHDKMPTRGYDGKWHWADYDVYGEYTYAPIGISPITARTATYKVDYYKPTSLVWDNPDGSDQAGGIVNNVIIKGNKQGSIVVVDTSNFPSQPTDAQFKEYGFRAVYSPYKDSTEPSHVARVIYMY